VEPLQDNARQHCNDSVDFEGHRGQAPCGANQRVMVKMDLIGKWLRARARGECVRGGEWGSVFRLLVAMCVNSG
jgi:hypothetical protein